MLALSWLEISLPRTPAPDDILSLSVEQLSLELYCGVSEVVVRSTVCYCQLYGLVSDLRQ